MGTDKAFVDIDGRPMVLRVVDALAAAGCEPVVCQGGDTVRLAAIGLEVLPDDSARPGPVQAIATALRRLDARIVVSACDLPGLTGGVVSALLDASDRTGNVTVAVAGGRRHLVSVWPPSARPALDDAVAVGVRPYRDVLDLVAADEIEIEEGALLNVNRPGDLPRAVLDRRDGGDNLHSR
jgi:molybdopterin-guanine dinucleotide biosynthesis protein A